MWRNRAAFVALVLGLVLGVGVLLGLFLPPIGSMVPGRPTYNTAAILTQVQGLSQLVTVKYVIEKVVVMEDVKWYGENRLLLLAHGVVKGGVDLSQMKPGDLEIRGKAISIRLPQASLTDVYLDDKKTRTIERSTGLIRTFDVNLEQNARLQAVNDIRIAARNSGIYDEANERAKSQLRSFLTLMGFESVEFRP